MKLQIFIKILLLSTLIALTCAKAVETDTEEFECVANYLKAKNLLEKSFKYFVQTEELDCDNHIIEIRETWLNKTLQAAFADDSSSEEDKDLAEFKKLYSQDASCLHDQLKSLNYPDVLMQIYVYKKSIKLSKKLKKKYLDALEEATVKKLALASTICFPEAFFGIMFDGMFEEDEDDAVETLEEKQGDYCITKFIVDKNLIDTNAVSVNLNPHNIDTNVDCTDHIEDAYEDSAEAIIGQFATESTTPRKQIRCMNRTIKEKETTEYLAKVAIYAESKINDEQKAVERAAFIQFMKSLYTELTKCIT